MSIGNLKGLDTQLDALDKKLPQTVARPSALLPQTTQQVAFTVAGGRVRLLQIVGEVTDTIETQANDAKIISNPTVGADVDLCAAVEISADAIGTMYNITGTLANAMVATTSGAMIAQANEIIVAVGTIDLDCAASNTGEWKWTLQYIPLDDGATVVAVPG